MKTLDATPSIHKLMEAWRAALSQVLTEAGLNAPVVETIDAKSCAEQMTRIAGKHCSFVLNAAGRLQGTLRLVMSEPEALRLSQVSAPEPAAKPAAAAVEFNEKQRTAAATLLNQAARRVIEAWTPGTVEFEMAPAAVDHADAELICGGLRAGAENLAPITILLGPSSEFVESLRLLEGQDPDGADVSLAAANASRGPSSNLDLLFDVQLDATIRFGGRQLLLREILALAPGSAIALDRQVDEPAELLVAGRLVARGEVVVVDGNFGLRITEVTSAHQRSEMLQA